MIVYHWRRRVSSVSYFPIVDVGAVESERPLAVGNVARPTLYDKGIDKFETDTEMFVNLITNNDAIINKVIAHFIYEKKKKKKKGCFSLQKKVREKYRECHNHKPQEKEETDKTKQTQIEQAYEKHQD